MSGIAPKRIRGAVRMTMDPPPSTDERNADDVMLTTPSGQKSCWVVRLA
jgi:hypothetical protein